MTDFGEIMIRKKIKQTKFFWLPSNIGPRLNNHKNSVKLRCFALRALLPVLKLNDVKRTFRTKDFSVLRQKGRVP